eukprot:TRINITY_DN2190_c0_g1_i2.p1 TRINITY_DN2190_c0_g1~~TRINITY_DN2190_c0_g1_i2.p1  ORF type:complete len:511 (-),score=90.56 TRINITY_DN2190_c0_g1_i2:958-2490(-)
MHGTHGEFKQVSQVRWAAPELIDSRSVGTEADIFSFGVILWEMLSFRTPWEHKTDDFQLAREILAGANLGVPAACHSLLAELLSDCFALQPAHRPSARTVYSRLQAMKQMLELDTQQAAAVAGLRVVHVTTASGSVLRSLVRAVQARKRISNSQYATRAKISEAAFTTWLGAEDDNDDTDEIRLVLIRMAEDGATVLGALRSKPMPEEKLTGFIDAIRKHDMGLFRMVVSQQFDLNGTSSKRPLHIACQEGHADMAELLLDNGAQLELNDFDGETPLAAAASYGRIEIVSHLLQRGANVNARSSKGNTPLIVACHRPPRGVDPAPFTAVVQHLLSMPGIQVNTGGQYGDTALHVAARNHHAAVVNMLLAHPDIDARTVNHNLVTPLQHLQQVGLLPDIQRLLLEWEAAHQPAAIPSALQGMHSTSEAYQPKESPLALNSTDQPHVKMSAPSKKASLSKHVLDKVQPLVSKRSSAVGTAPSTSPTTHSKTEVKPASPLPTKPSSVRASKKK